MGTNYYVKDKCECCNHETSIHIGKSSSGWKFLFQWNDGIYYKTPNEMMIWLKDKTIKDEYGELVTLDEFWFKVASKQTGSSHSSHDETVNNLYDDYIVIGEFEFLDADFT